MLCSNCQTELAPGAKFCQACGTPVPKKPAIDVDQRIGTVEGTATGAVIDSTTSASGLDVDVNQNVDTVASGGTLIGGVYGGGDQPTFVGGQHQHGDTYSGDFRGAILNVRSTLQNVTQSIDNISAADQSAKDELKGLVAQLEAELQATPPDRAEEAEAVSTLTEEVVQQASADKPNRALLDISADGLKKAAENIADVLPTVLGIATRIVTVISGLPL